jgi:hypothetical protein
VFRNETKATERRAQKANRKTLAQKGGKQEPFINEASSSTSLVTAQTPRKGSVASTLKIPTKEVATCHFVSNFILTPRDGRTIGHLEFVLPLLKQEGPDSHFHHAFNACAMAFLNNRGGMGVRLWDSALSEYSLALAKTNAALRDEQTQQSDATLASVLLLGMFEVLYYPLPRYPGELC